MNIIFYAPVMDPDACQTWTLLENLDTEFGVELHKSTKSLDQRLRQPLQGIAAILLYVDDGNHLAELLPLKELLNDLPLIIILKEADSEIMKKVHTLRPRVVLGSRFHFHEIVHVIENMVRRQKSLEYEGCGLSP